MTLKDDMVAYRDRWQAMAEMELQELLTTSIETKWRQLNSIVNLAIRWGFFKPDPSDEVVHQQWAKLKGKTDQQSR